VVLLFAFTLGLSLMVAVLHAYYRDVQPVLNAALLPLFFVSGVLFRIQTLPGLNSHPWAGPLLQWGNPIAPFVTAMQDVIYFGQAPSAAVMGYVLAAAVVSLALGVTLFRRMEGELAVVL
jgi:ABC-type polysaccharide/polyol phosphate export permease